MFVLSFGTKTDYSICANLDYAVGIPGVFESSRTLLGTLAWAWLRRQCAEHTHSHIKLSLSQWISDSCLKNVRNGIHEPQRASFRREDFIIGLSEKGRKQSAEGGAQESGSIQLLGGTFGKDFW